eukprot:CFRG5491T1
MSKRSRGNEDVHKDNYEAVEEEESQYEKTTNTTASSEVLKKRNIAVPRKRAGGSNISIGGSTPKLFEFSSSSGASPFAFGMTKTTTSQSESNPSSAFLGQSPFASASTSTPFSTAASTSVPSFGYKTNSFMSANPFANLKPSEKEKEEDDQNEKEEDGSQIADKPTTTTTKFGGFGLPSNSNQPAALPKFGGFDFSKASTGSAITSTNPPQMQWPSTDSKEIAKKPASVEVQHKATTSVSYSDKFLSEMKTLNEDFSNQVTNVDSTLVMDYTLVCEEYCRIVRDLKKAEQSAISPAAASSTEAANNFKEASKFPITSMVSPMTMPKTLTKAEDKPTNKADGEPSDNIDASNINVDMKEDGEYEGEENESNLFWAKCKLFLFSKETKEFKSLGVGVARVNKFKEGDMVGKSRLLVREWSPVMKLLLNAFLYSQLSPTKKGNKDVCVSFPSAEEGMSSYLLRFKDLSTAEKFIEHIEQNRG